MENREEFRPKPVEYEEDDFLDDTPRKWVPNEKLDADGLSVKHHLLICHVAIIAGCFLNDRFPNLEDKYIQYHKERNLKSIRVKVDNFYKSNSSVLFSDKDTYDEKGEFEILRKNYISSKLIEEVTPFIQRWYPSAVIFIQTLNITPDRLETIHYYWIYRSIRGKYFQESMKHFYDNHCPHLSYDTFKYHHKQNRKAEIPCDLAKFIKPYIKKHYPDALNSTNC